MPQHTQSRDFVSCQPGAIRAARAFAVALGLALTLMFGAPMAGAEPAGPYLVARQALMGNDFPAASEALARALAGDPGNMQLADAAVAAALGEGRITRAAEVAARMAAAGAVTPQATLAEVAQAISRGDFGAAGALLDRAPAAGALGDGLIRGWIAAGEGDMGGAIAIFEETGRLGGADAIVAYNIALARAVAGDFEAADALLTGPAAPVIESRRGILLRIEVLAQIDEADTAVALIDTAFDIAADPAVAALRAQLVAGEPVAYGFVRDAREGIAELFHTLALALRRDEPDTLSLVYGQLARHLGPDRPDTALLVAELLEEVGQYGLAIGVYDAIAPGSADMVEARIGRARALNADGRGAEALEALRALVRDEPARIEAHVALGDLLRSEEAYAEAAEAYTRAIDLIATPEPRHWSLFYSRAICLERAKKWDRAEPDFRTALRLLPDQPMVLNYLGYSFLEMGTNLDEAMALIRRAVDQRPDSGHIVDSLAWGYFLLGEYEAALEPMERASLLMPVDPIVTDHLGDVYWAVGRKREAEFQWRRALSFEPEPELAERIRRKLQIGLDATLAEEGAPSLADRARR